MNDWLNCQDISNSLAYFLEIFNSAAEGKNKTNKTKSDIKSLKMLIIDIKWSNSFWYIGRNHKIYEIRYLKSETYKTH